MSEWNICAPGPTLDWSKVERRPTICVNTALFQAPFADYWCCRDKPNETLEQVKFHVKRLRPILIYGHSPEAEKQWRSWCEAMLDSDQQPADIVTVGWDTLPWVKLEVDPNPQFTIFTALIFAITRQATTIYLHGVGMTGEGYHDERLRPAKQDWNLRWAWEKQLYRRFVAGAARRGVTIINPNVG